MVVMETADFINIVNFIKKARVTYENAEDMVKVKESIRKARAADIKIEEDETQQQ